MQECNSYMYVMVVSHLDEENVNRYMYERFRNKGKLKNQEFN